MTIPLQTSTAQMYPMLPGSQLNWYIPAVPLKATVPSVECPDMTFAVDWVLKANYLSIYLATGKHGKSVQQSEIIEHLFFSGSRCVWPWVKVKIKNPKIYVMHSHDRGSHLVKFDSYSFTDFWDMAGGGQTDRHRQHGLIDVNQFKVFMTENEKNPM